MKKLCEFTEEEYSVLEHIMSTVPEVTTVMGAIRFLIKRYELELSEREEAKEITLYDILIQLQKIQKTLSYTERNSEINVNALNTLLMLSNSKACYLTDVYKHPVIQYAEENITDKIIHNKQRKDFNNGKKSRKK